MIIGYKTPLSVSLDGTIGPMVKGLARKRFASFCKAVMKHKQISKLMVREAACSIHKECSQLVSTKEPSVLRKKAKTELMEFSWVKLAEELQERAPILFCFLSAAAAKSWTRKTTAESTSSITHICMALAILLKAQNKHMSAVQSVVSLLLNAGHASSLVCVAN